MPNDLRSSNSIAPSPVPNSPAAPTDFALPSQKPLWLSHPVCGDPAFDSFQRHPANPILRGTPGLEWPVNGFYFLDPVSHHHFLYVGHYPQGYALGPDKKQSTCTVLRSTDAGQTWQHLGPVFPPEPFHFEGDTAPITGAPNVSVCYANGRYHLAYDWALEGADWTNLCSRLSGIGYAWSDKPHGPFHRTPHPILRNDLPAKSPLLGKYNRLYATTLLRRKSDWLTLSLMDAGANYSWGLAAMTAHSPEGPYKNLTPIFHLEANTYHPPLMEYFPAFLHEGWLYAPATSVALNRDFQTIHRAPLEDAHRPEAWQLFHHGSFLRGSQHEHESAGIWGQTFSGFVDQNNQLQIMYPSKDREDRGTINLASRPFNQPHADRGFALSGHLGPSLTLLKLSYDDFTLDAHLHLEGTATLFWANTAPLGPSAPTADSTLHPLSTPTGSALRLTHDTWTLLSRLQHQPEQILASGPLTEPPKTLRIQRTKSGHTTLTLNQKQIHTGPIHPGAGTIGLLADKHSTLTITQFILDGQPTPATLSWLHTEAQLGAGQHKSLWQETTSPLFRHHTGAVSTSPTARAKWNFLGSKITLWSPKGPDYGIADLFLDNQPARTLDLHAPTPTPSQPVFTLENLPQDYHALSLRPRTGNLPLDSLDVT